MPAPTKHKLNIFQVLGSLSKKNIDFYDKLTEEELKGLHPLVVMRWMSGTQDARQIVFLNELVNSKVFPLTHHKRLLVNLLSASASGSGGRVQWIKAASKKTTKTPTVVSVVKDMYGYNNSDAIESARLLTNEDILEMAETLGYQSDQLRLIKKELKTRA